MISDAPGSDTGLESSDAEAASTDHGQPDAEAEPVAAGQECPQGTQVVELRNRPNSARISETPSPAPTVGAVRDLPDAALGEAIGFRTPAVVLDGVTAGGYCVAAASLIGTAHSVAGSVRQDAYDFIASTTGSLVVVVADGLGSKTHSQVGARLVCEGVLLATADAPDEVPSASELISAGAAHASQIASNAYGLADDDISVVAAVAVFGSSGCEIARIGDASAFAVNADAHLTELFAPDSGYVNVVRSSVPGSPSEAAEIVTSSAVTVALVTDGLANDLRTSAAVRSWLGEQWQAPLGPHAMGDSLRYRRQGSHDDRTAVVVWSAFGP